MLRQMICCVCCDEICYCFRNVWSVVVGKMNYCYCLPQQYLMWNLHKNPSLLLIDDLFRENFFEADVVGPPADCSDNCAVEGGFDLSVRSNIAVVAVVEGPYHFFVLIVPPGSDCNYQIGPLFDVSLVRLMNLNSLTKWFALQMLCFDYCCSLQTNEIVNF